MSRGIGITKKELTHGKFGCKCAYCGISISIIDMHIDHINPKKLGGKSDIKNLNPSCQKCNTTKGGKNLEDYRLHMRIKKSKFSGVINASQWRELSYLGVDIPLPTHSFYFEGGSNE
ncbi:HNH endonuclease [Providencia rettgeri]